jgi:hypothetical protein
MPSYSIASFLSGIKISNSNGFIILLLLLTVLILYKFKNSAISISAFDLLLLHKGQILLYVNAFISL